ncbi:MAG: hypothetical protein LBM16_03355 [Clostridiales bacterium]|jgi:hypothetical protein|nr:hypothetical protein [Clostridiales bacterium]
MNKLSPKDMTVFAMLGTIMFCSFLLMQWIPNIHLLAALICAETIVYRKYALYPIYVFVLLTFVHSGFAPWYIPYFYIWTVLWAGVMLIPKNIPKKSAPFVYMGVCGLHGLLFGIMYAPFNALLFGMSFEATVAWVISGFPFDIVHAFSNFFFGIIVLPITKIMKKNYRLSWKN